MPSRVVAAPPLLPRRPLVDRLERSLGARVVRVVASAGSGKSTLVRLFAQRARREVVHVPLDHRSPDASFFFWQLLDALGLDRPDLLPERSTPLENVRAIAAEVGGYAIITSALVCGRNPKLVAAGTGSKTAPAWHPMDTHRVSSVETPKTFVRK